MPPGGLFGQTPHPTAAFPHLKGQDEPSEDITSMNEKMYEGIDCSDLVEQLKDTDTLHEQADIIHYLYTTKYVCCVTAFNFYARKQLCFQRVLAIAVLSVRLSVTRVDQSKTVQDRITKFSSSAARKTLVSGTVKLFHKFEGGHSERGH